MDKTLTIQHYVPAKGSATSDCQIDFGYSTAKTDNLAAIMKNNTILFESLLTISNISIGDPVDDAKAKSKGQPVHPHGRETLQSEAAQCSRWSCCG
jgi:hypothetical protein